MDALHCERIRKVFGRTHAVSDVTLSFPTGAITAIIGPNGSGKTTLVNVLTGFVRPKSGCWFLGSREITGFSADRIARLGVCRTFQDVRLIRQVSVLDNVILGRPSQSGEQLLPALLRRRVATEERDNRGAAMGLLRFVGLGAYANRLALELSYGQQKMLALACCLATEARVVLLDEPVAGVAPPMAAQTLECLRCMRNEGKLIVFIEHDMEAVRALADVVVVMDDGKVIAQGPTDDILERPEIMRAYLG